MGVRLCPTISESGLTHCPITCQRLYLSLTVEYHCSAPPSKHSKQKKRGGGAEFR